MHFNQSRIAFNQSDANSLKSKEQQNTSYLSRITYEITTRAPQPQDRPPQCPAQVVLLCCHQYCGESRRAWRVGLPPRSILASLLFVPNLHKKRPGFRCLGRRNCDQCIPHRLENVTLSNNIGYPNAVSYFRGELTTPCAFLRL